ncbi:class I SAM-dependent methyltransferase [Burkholderia sp. AU33545]|nr:class I SAM-dependent methyltransferase [Burkholderia sp. AU33545]MCA8200388.1 class I SAM-dependent methyltransferase [Burkholderia sp. AU33545]
MNQVLQYFAARCHGKTRILDIPSGSGVFAASLNALGHDVVQADIHGYDDSVVADMEAPLPFQNDEFSAVTCLEAGEHVLHPANSISELVRESGRMASSSFQRRMFRICIRARSFTGRRLVVAT